MSQLINPVGPEANNRRAHEFEDHIVSFAATLGWDARCRNIDLYNATGSQSAGVDVLLAFDDPQLGNREGLIGEAKIRHPLATSNLRDEVSRLAKKLATLGPVIPKLSLAEDLAATRVGLLAYDAAPYEPKTLSEALSAIQQEGLTRAQWPREVLVIGPDTLIGLADCIDEKPSTRYYWPPFDQRAGAWSKSAPPQQVAAGMLAIRAGSTTTLWLRDHLDHDEDFLALTTVAWEWRINIDRIVCTSVDRDRYMAVVDRWRTHAKKSQDQDVGRVPDAIDPRGLSFQSLTAFNDRWGRAA